ncbi:MAG: hypothetical protein R3264_09025, partial [Anaerolineae bacterium]|nr:hypothetical protein [Anaerolineae bacterium]
CLALSIYRRGVWWGVLSVGPRRPLGDEVAPLNRARGGPSPGQERRLIARSIYRRAGMVGGPIRRATEAAGR